MVKNKKNKKTPYSIGKRTPFSILGFALSQDDKALDNFFGGKAQYFTFSDDVEETP